MNMESNMMESTQTLIYNAIRTPDGTILQSKHRHDYKTYVDKTNGFEYMVDGGLDYLRRAVGAPFDELSFSYEDVDHRTARDYISWGTYGPKGDQPLKFVLLRDMENDHIGAILDNGFADDNWKVFFENEIKYRMNKPVAYIENANIVKWSWDPDNKTEVLKGYCTRHDEKRWLVDDWITTSWIERKFGDIIETRNTLYHVKSWAPPSAPVTTYSGIPSAAQLLNV